MRKWFQKDRNRKMVVWGLTSLIGVLSVMSWIFSKLNSIQIKLPPKILVRTFVVLLLLFLSFEIVDNIADRLWKQQFEKVVDFYYIQWSYLQNQWAETGKTGVKPDDPQRPILVIDPLTSEIRLEHPGNPHPGENLKLPRDWKWEFFYWAESGPQSQDSPIRLRMRSQIFNGELRTHGYPEGVELRGTHRWTRQKISLPIMSRDLKYPQRVFKGFEFFEFFPDINPISQRVNDSEYETARQSWTQTPSQPDTTPEESRIMEERWVRFQDRLAPQLRAHFTAMKWTDVSLLLIRPNTDRLRGHIQVAAQKDTTFLFIPIRPLMSLHKEVDGYDLQYLGGTTWGLMGRNNLENDDFVLSGDPGENPETWSEVFKRVQNEHNLYLKHRNTLDWDPRYTANLADNARVELIGLSERATPDAQWWRPDGKPLDWQPYVICKQDAKRPPKERWIAYAYRIVQKSDLPPYRPGNNAWEIDNSTGMTGEKDCPYSLEDCEDQWGWWIDFRSLHYAVVSFNENLRTTDFHLKLEKHDGQETSLIFRNITLYPDQPTSFTIETAQKEGR